MSMFRRRGTAPLACMIAAAMGCGATAVACPGDLNGDGVVDPADLSLLLAAWGTSGSFDLDGDGVVSGADLGLMLASWGDCAPACAGYEDLAYAGIFVGGIGQPIPGVVLTGTIDVLPTGEPQGTIFAIFADGTVNLLNFALSTTTILSDSALIVLPSEGPPESAIVDGFTTTIPDMLAAFQSDLELGLPPGLWSSSGRAVLALAALCETQPFACNLHASLDAGSSLASAFWCKTGTVAVGGGIVARAKDGCEEFADCADINGVVAIGAFDMPCSNVTPLCAKGDFAGPQSAFASVLGLWLGQ